MAPLETHSGLSSPHTPQGYHTPVDDDYHPVSLTPQRLSQLLGVANNAPTPTSGAYTISLDGYMDPGRMSIGSPPHSDSHRIILSDEEESFPVFSPPPYEEAVFRRRTHRRSHSSGNHPFNRRSYPRRRRSSAVIPPPVPKVPPWSAEDRRHSSSLSIALSHHTCNVPPLSLPEPSSEAGTVHSHHSMLSQRWIYAAWRRILHPRIVIRNFYDLPAVILAILLI
jgi:hypothetical protein